MNFFKNVETTQKMVKNMNRPKTITQLSREQLEDFCLSLFHVDNEKANIIEELELKNEALEKEIQKLKQPTIFIDTQDMEERYCDGLYVDYLEEENKSLKEENKKLKQWDCNKDSRNSRQRVANAKLIKENNLLKDKYNQALSILAELEPPCELDGFMDKNVDYCFTNCGVDEEVFKECWNRYIQQKLDAKKG